MDADTRWRCAIVVVMAAWLLPGLALARWGDGLIASVGSTSEVMNTAFVDCWTDDPPDTLDPGYLKDVAWSEARCDPDEHGRRHTVVAGIHNAYPSYTTQVGFTLRNEGTEHEQILSVDVNAPSELDIEVSRSLTGWILGPGGSVDGTVAVHVTCAASQSAFYPFTVALQMAPAQNGTIGFWRAWDKHGTFSRNQIAAWLLRINADSRWLGPTTIDGMEATLRAAAGGSAQERFLGHYLATRLNLCGGLLMGPGVHDVTGVDPGNYLGLPNPANATLHEIINAIESKHGTGPTRSQYLLMKDVCDALNNREI
ncbi:MAG: hypothetical protein KGZ40_02305 [Clostridiales bacterium]|nr:hypothetical protein [Clostridiales bacterium]